MESSLILIDGGIEIHTTWGEKRQFKSGDVPLLEDTEGKGHRTQKFKALKRKSIFMRVR